MLPLHYASFFDAAPILRVLLKASNARGMAVRLRTVPPFVTGLTFYTSSMISVDVINF